MPATAGRVRMPANNRVHSSAALQTHGIWQSAIGYDPYAPNKDENKNSVPDKTSNLEEPETENAYASFQGLLALARITGSNADEARGSCKKCGRVGHLSFQCRNFLSMKDDNKEKDIQADIVSELDKLKGRSGKGNGKNLKDSSEESEDDDSETSDTDVDSEIERIIAKRQGNKVKRKKPLKKEEETDSDEADKDSGRRNRRGRSKKRSDRREVEGSDDSDSVRRNRRKEKRRKRDESTDEDEKHHHKRESRKEKRRRRSHHHSDDSDSAEPGRRHRRKSRRAADSDDGKSDDSRIGRGKKRSERKSTKYN